MIRTKRKKFVKENGKKNYPESSGKVLKKKNDIIRIVNGKTILGVSMWIYH